MTDGPDLDGIESETEEIDAIPVFAEEASLPMPAAGPPALAPFAGRRLPALSELRSVPAVQAAAVAAGGFMAGAAVVGLARRRRSGALSRRRPAGRGRVARERGNRMGRAELLQIVGSRSLLVDVHLLGEASHRR